MIAVIFASLLAGGGSGAGMQAYISAESYNNIKHQIEELKDTNREQYQEISSISRLQTKCGSAIDMIQFRFEMMDKLKK